MVREEDGLKYGGGNLRTGQNLDIFRRKRQERLVDGLDERGRKWKEI